MKIKALKSFSGVGYSYAKGAEVNHPDSEQCKKFIKEGLAVLLEKKAAKKNKK